MKTVKLILWSLSLILCAGSAQAQFNFNFNKLIDTVKKVAEATTEIDEPREIEIGEGVASNLLGAAPLVANANMQKYVNLIGRWLASQTERPDLPWNFGVLDSANVNAFATPGGSVFITRGLLQKMHSEAELAGVLAHEISHVLRKHHLKAIQKNAGAGLMGDMVGEATKNNSNRESLGKIVNFGTEMYARGLDKSDEFEADRMGVVIAARAGYDPYGLPAVLQTLQGAKPQDSDVALMFKTHPSPSDRLDILETLLPAKLDSYASQPQLTERFLDTLGIK
jgi:predicted Zn-dependent protease